MQKTPTDMTEAEFMATFGDLYEHSPWIATAVFNGRLNSLHNDVAGLQGAFRRVVKAASHERQFELLRAHPDLAGKLARADALTTASRSEQAGAGLDRCTDEEFGLFTELNNQYKAKFGFPFIMAVKAAKRAEILLQFQQRLENNPETEFETAIEQVLKIGWFRLTDLFND